MVGQAHVVQTLRNAVELDRVAHAYLFAGPRGTGKTSMAKILAKSINCEQGPTVTPCLVCESCRSIHDATAIDVIEMDAASHRGIDDIREIRDRVALRPARGRMKVYIVDEAHMLTKEASNAVLKTLEEPPDHVVFVLCTTELQAMLPTIRSRCQRFVFQRPGLGEISEVLRRIATAEGIEIDDAAVQLVARAAGGSFRDGVTILDQLSTAQSAAIGAEDVRTLLGTADEASLFGAIDLVGGGRRRRPPAPGRRPGRVGYRPGLVHDRPARAPAGPVPDPAAGPAAARPGAVRPRAGAHARAGRGGQPARGGAPDRPVAHRRRRRQGGRRPAPAAGAGAGQGVAPGQRAGAGGARPAPVAAGVERRVARAARAAAGRRATPRSQPLLRRRRPFPTRTRQPTPEPEPQAAAAPVATAVAEPATLEQVSARWSEAIVPEIGRRSVPLHSLVQSARPVSYEDDTLVLGLTASKAFAKSIIEAPQNLQTISDVVGQALGGSPRVRFVVLGAEDAAGRTRGGRRTGRAGDRGRAGLAPHRGVRRT